jgi:antitoxin ParD1/3/4
VASMNVSLPEAMKAWVEAQADTGRYANASDYVRDLIRRDQERLAKLGDLQRLIDEGLASGVSDRSEQDIRQLGRTRLAARPEP